MLVRIFNLKNNKYFGVETFNLLRFEIGFGIEAHSVGAWNQLIWGE